MPISVEVKEQLIKEFSASQTYEGMNALQLAQQCCEKLAMLGQPLPGWREIREIIGKGSANDINKGKREYQDQQGKKLTQLNEMPGVTEDMVEVMMLLRQKAFDVVSDSFKTQVIGWQNQVAEFRRQADESDERCEAAIRERDSWERQANDRQALIDGLSEQLEDSRRSSKSNIGRLEVSLEEARSQAMVANQRYEQATANIRR
ncbi:DNA-binding protein [Serratia symbiotica]|uniref:DNA-binding protein n=1 Tax=Serratia symbiotica TaxID=138074 RepID=UPI00132BBE60|nr:DNA-binding protein [Serratia symbiotica]QTP13381.1 DNA-binding protein [Serratia symbiotica]